MCPIRRGGEFKHEARVERGESSARNLGITAMPLIEHNHWPNYAQRIPETLLYPRRAFAAQCGLSQIQVFEIWNVLAQLGARGRIVLRKKTCVVTGVLEDLQRFLVLAPCRLQHQKENAKLLFEILTYKSVELFQHLHAPATGAIKCLANWVDTISKLLLGLGVDGFRRHDPKHESGHLSEVADENAVDPVRGEQGLAAAGRQLKADVRNGVARTILKFAPWIG